MPLETHQRRPGFCRTRSVGPMGVQVVTDIWAASMRLLVPK